MKRLLAFFVLIVIVSGVVIYILHPKTTVIAKIIFQSSETHVIKIKSDHMMVIDYKAGWPTDQGIFSDNYTAYNGKSYIIPLNHKDYAEMLVLLNRLRQAEGDKDEMSFQYHMGAAYFATKLQDKLYYSRYWPNYYESTEYQTYQNYEGHHPDLLALGEKILELSPVQFSLY